MFLFYFFFSFDLIFFFNFRPWLVCSCFGMGDALRMALMEENLVPAAGVAVPLERGKSFSFSFLFCCFITKVKRKKKEKKEERKKELQPNTFLCIMIGGRR